MPKCKDCLTVYRNMDHSVYDCAQAGGKEARRMMNQDAARVNNAVLYGTPEMVSEAETTMRAHGAEIR